MSTSKRKILIFERDGLCQCNRLSGKLEVVDEFSHLGVISKNSSGKADTNCRSMQGRRIGDNRGHW